MDSDELLKFTAPIVIESGSKLDILESRTPISIDVIIVKEVDWLFAVTGTDVATLTGWKSLIKLFIESPNEFADNPPEGSCDGGRVKPELLLTGRLTAVVRGF